MALTPREVKKIAALARLRFTPDEEAKLADQLGRIVDYIDLIQRFEGADPEAEAGTGREDEDRARPGLSRERFLANAPRVRDAFLVVPEIHPGFRPGGRSGDG